MSKPLVTTVIPTYRRPEMLRRALRSVLGQTYRDFQVCVYDNASGDDTGAVVDEFRKQDSRVTYLCRPRNIGPALNFIDGAKRVETPFFSFLSDDDLMLPHFLETAVAGFQRHPEAALSILPTLHMSPSGMIIDAFILRWPAGLIAPPNGMFFTLLHGNPGLQAMLIRTDIWNELGGFDEATTPAEEFDFDLRVMAHFPVVVAKEPGAIQVMHRGTSTELRGLSWVWPCIPRIIEKVSQDKGLRPDVRQEAVEQLTNWMVRGLMVTGIVRSLVGGKWADAEKAADLLFEQGAATRTLRLVRHTISVCRTVPGTRLALRALLALQIGKKLMHNIPWQWRFRDYSRLLREGSALDPCFSGLSSS